MKGLKIIILSRGRYDSMTTHILMPFATLLVPVSEKNQYFKFKNKVASIETIPDKYVGLGQVRNWILSNYKEDIIMVDDDIRHLSNLMYITPIKIQDPNYIYQLLVNQYQIAKDMGVKVFSFSQKGDVRKFVPYKPYLLASWGGCVIGVIGKDLHLCNNKFKVDIDLFLQSILKDRITLIDERFSFIQIRDSNSGGNSSFRTQDEVDLEVEYLKGKWGKYLNFKTVKGTIGASLRVIRKT